MVHMNMYYLHVAHINTCWTNTGWRWKLFCTLWYDSRKELWIWKIFPERTRYEKKGD